MRRLVIERAHECCEYCGKPVIGFFPHEVDHVISEKHGGETSVDNLAYACFECNRYKGSDIASFDPDTQQLSPLFNPRHDTWSEHFRYDYGRILPVTSIGRTTVKLLKLNDRLRVEERRTLGIGL
jgi:hypothetical protein